MSDIRVLGLNIAKSVFPLHGVDVDRAIVLQRRLTRGRMDFITFGDEFAIARLNAPKPVVGLPLAMSQLSNNDPVAAQLTILAS